MGIDRNLCANCFEDVDLTWRVVDVVFTANHMGDAHIPVIHDDAEVVGWRTIGAADDQVIQFLVAELNRATDLVVKDDRTFLRIAETHNARLIICMMFMAVTAAAVVTWLFVVGHLLFTQRFQTFFRAVAFIGCARFQHFINDRVVTIKTFCLVVRAFIPVEAQPVHAIHDGFDSFRRGALQIRIFNAQHELALVVTGKEPGVKCGTSATYMQIASRAGREACFDFH